MFRILFLAAAVSAAPTLWACSTCLCGDPTLTLTGTDKPFAGRQRISADFLVRDETQGEPGVDDQRFEEMRYSLGYAYSPSSRWTLTAQLPYVQKTVSAASLASTDARGIGDLELGVKVFLQPSREIPVRELYGLMLGLRLPTAQEQDDQNGQPVDVDALPGSGAYVPSFGGWYGRYAFPWLFYVSASFQYALDEGYQGYRPGDAIVGTALAQYAVLPELALQVALDFRQTEPNTFSGNDDENSGGFLAQLAPRAVWNFWPEWSLNAGVQIPLIESYNGKQSNEPTYSVGLSYDLPTGD